MSLTEFHTEFEAINASDMEAVLAIEQQAFSRPWSRVSFLEELSHPYSFHYAMSVSPDSRFPLPFSHLIAYICFHIIADEMELLKIAVAPQWRRYGAGSRMMDKSLRLAVQKGAKSAFLEVRTSNHSAINLYHQFGFQIIGKRSGYYPETKEDALVMMKKLKGK